MGIHPEQATRLRQAILERLRECHDLVDRWRAARPLLSRAVGATPEGFVDRFGEDLRVLEALDADLGASLREWVEAHYGGEASLEQALTAALHRERERREGARGEVARDLAGCAQALAAAVHRYDRDVGDRLRLRVHLGTQSPIWSDLLRPESFERCRAVFDDFANEHALDEGVRFFRLTEPRGRHGFNPPTLIVEPGWFEAGPAEALQARLRTALAEVEPALRGDPRGRPMLVSEPLDVTVGDRFAFPPIALPGYYCLASFLRDFHRELASNEEARRADRQWLERLLALDALAHPAPGAPPAGGEAQAGGQG